MSTTFPEEIFKFLERAEDALLTAEHDLNGGFILATTNRTYYSCFYCMTALLYTKQIKPKTHQGTQIKFAEQFLKTQIFPEHSFQLITTLFGHRQEADYDINFEISDVEARNLISQASEFLRLTKDYFNHLSADDNSSSQ